MRRALSLTVLLAAAALAGAQPPGGTEIPPRFDVRAKPKTYPQADPKQALASLVAAHDAGDHNYILAHLMDPQFVDARIAVRATQLKDAVEADSRKLRDVQRPNIGNVPRESRVPEEPTAFEAYVLAQARLRAVPSLVADVKDKLADDPQVLKDLRRFAREGTFTDDGNSARATLPDLKDRAMFFKKIGERWFVENRQTDDAKKDPEEKKKNPEEKKP